MSEENTPDSSDNVTEPQAETSWQQDAGLDGNASFEKFANVGDLAKSYTELENYQAGSIRIPGSDAGEEQMEKFYGRLDEVDGVMRTPENYTPPPQEASGYTFDEVEGFTGDESVGALKAEALKLGMTPAQANGIHHFLATNVVANQTEADTANVNAMNELKGMWGAAFEQKMEGINNTMAALSKELPFLETAEKTPQLAQLMDFMGKMLGESGPSRQDPRSAITPQDASLALSDLYQKYDGVQEGDSGYAAFAARRVELQKMGGRLNFAHVDDY